MNKVIKRLIALVLVGFAGFFFFYRMYHRYVSAFKGFSAAFEKFDKAVSDLSATLLASNPAGTPAADDLGRKADDALAELKSKASVRISSLIKNDVGFMSLTREIADLSGKELDTLKAYKRAAADKNSNSEQLAKEFADLRNQRQAAYVRFLELAK